MRRAFGFDVLACPRCGHAMRLIALIEQENVIRRILRHLGEPIGVPAPAPARAPPPVEERGVDPNVHEAPRLVYDQQFAPTSEEPC